MFERIRDLREDRDISQSQMAQYLQVHQTSIDYLVGLTDNFEPYK